MVGASNNHTASQRSGCGVKRRNDEMNELSSRMTEAKDMQSIPTRRGGMLGAAVSLNQAVGASSLPQYVILSEAKNLKGRCADKVMHPTADIALRSFGHGVPSG